MKPVCPKCRQILPADDINVAENVALCRACGEAHPFSDLLHNVELSPSALSDPPRHCWYEEEGFDKRFGASHRSAGGALGALAVSLFWNGITSLFVMVNLSSTLNLMGVGLPAWFPAPEMNGDTMGLGMTLFLWLFLTPFMVIGLCMLGAFVMYLGGKTEVRLAADKGSVFTGFAGFGIRKHFDPGKIARAGLRIRDDEAAILIEDSDGNEIKFGKTLNRKRREFIAGALRKALPR